MSVHDFAAMAADLASFNAHLRQSTRILALLGAGVSAPSGLPTFRGAGGIWRNHDATSLATPEAFEENPALVWTFYNYRRHMALQAKPNKAHLALAELARRHSGFMTLTQNVDDLSDRAGHPSSQIKQLHGSLFDLKCASSSCDYFETGNFQDPVVPALAMPSRARAPELSPSDVTGREAGASLTTAMQDVIKPIEVDIADSSVALAKVERRNLPHCPVCKSALLRPAVVWFGEELQKDVLQSITEWIEMSPQIDLMLLIGTSAEVYPAAGYTDIARKKGARIAIVNMDKETRTSLGSGDLERKKDWYFQADAAEIVPLMLESVIGTLPKP